MKTVDVIIIASNKKPYLYKMDKNTLSLSPTFWVKGKTKSIQYNWEYLPIFTKKTKNFIWADTYLFGLPKPNRAINKSAGLKLIKKLKPRPFDSPLGRKMYRGI